MAQVTGKVTNVHNEDNGSTLAEDVAAGSFVLPVDDAFDFEETGGTLQIGSEVIPYLAADYDLDTLTLVLATTNAYSQDEQVLTVPGGSTKWAMVDLNDTDEGIQAVVPTEMSAVVMDGVREEVEQETVICDDSDGRWKVITINGETPSVQGQYVDGTGLPAPIPTAPPGSSPDLKVSGNATSLVLEAVGYVVPGTRIRYHVSTVDGFVPGPDNVFTETPSKVVVVNTLPGDPNPLPADTPFYAVALAVNDAGEAAAYSPQVSDSLHMDVVAETVLARLVAGFVLAGTIQVGQVLIDAVTGITIPQPDGGTITFPADGSDSLITAKVVARALDIEDNLRIKGSGQLLGELELANGISAPKTSPVQSDYWQNWQSLAMGNGTTNVAGIFNGLAEYDNDTWMTAVSYFGCGVKLISKHAAGDVDYAGSDAYFQTTFFDPTFGMPWCSQFYPDGGLARIGNYVYLLGTDGTRSGNYYIYKIFVNSRTVTLAASTTTVATLTTSAAHGYVVGDVVNVDLGPFHWANGQFTITAVTSTTFSYSLSTTAHSSAAAPGTVSVWQKAAELLIGNINAFNNHTPRIATNGTSLYMLWSLTTSQVNMRRYDTNLVVQANNILLSGLTSYKDWGGFVVGQPVGAGGAGRIIFQEKNGPVYVVDSGTVVRQTAEEYSRPNSQSVWGLAYDTYSGAGARGLRLVSFDGYGRFYRYSKNPTDLSIKAQHTWYDGVGTTHETQGGTISTRTLPRRKFLRVETDQAPDINNLDPANNDKANQIRLYLGSGGAAPRLESTWAVGVRSGVYETILNSGSTPPGSNGFAGAAVTPGVFLSEATDVDGEILKLSGDGSARLGDMKLDANGHRIDTRYWSQITSGVTNLTTTSNVLIVGTAITLTVKHPSEVFRVTCQFDVEAVSSPTSGSFVGRPYIDGAAAGGIYGVVRHTAVNERTVIAIVPTFVTGLAAGSHTFDIRASVSATPAQYRTIGMSVIVVERV